MIRRISAYFLLLSISHIGFAQAAPPQRVVSTNLCTDIYVHLLLPPERIAALSDMAVNTQYSPIASELTTEGIAKPVNIHGGRAEEIIAVTPDMIVAPAHSYGVVQLLEKLGHPVERIKLGFRLEDVPTTIIAMGDVLGVPERAQEVLNAFEAAKQNAATAGIAERKLSGLVFGANGYTAGRDSLKSDVLAVMGLSNAAERVGLIRSAALNVEQILAAKPDILMIDDSSENKNSLAQSIIAHPALRALPITKQLRLSSNHWICASPYVETIWQQLESALTDVDPTLSMSNQ